MLGCKWLRVFFYITICLSGSIGVVACGGSGGGDDDDEEVTELRSVRFKAYEFPQIGVSVTSTQESSVAIIGEVRVDNPYKKFRKPFSVTLRNEATGRSYHAEGTYKYMCGLNLFTLEEGCGVDGKTDEFYFDFVALEPGDNKLIAKATMAGVTRKYSRTVRRLSPRPKLQTRPAGELGSVATVVLPAVTTSPGAQLLPSESTVSGSVGLNNISADSSLQPGSDPDFIADDIASPSVLIDDGTPENMISYHYDANGNLSIFARDRDGDGAPDTIHTWTYDANGNQLTYSRDRDGDGAPDEIQTWSYDADGNPLTESWDHDGDGAPETIHTWTYDADGNQLTYSRDRDGDGAPDEIQGWIYDSNGNLLTSTLSTTCFSEPCM